MTTQPEALRLADELEKWTMDDFDAAAAELRRLHAQRDALLEALKLALSSHGVMLMSDPPQEAWKVWGVEEKARAAIKMAEEE